MEMKRLGTYLTAAFFGAGAVALAGFGAAPGKSLAGENFEKCYGISEIGQNDGWDQEINPGKYKSDFDFDGKAWAFVRAGTCLKLGGKLEPFAGVGTPVRENQS